ncbi:band 3 anion transport protein-like isoform X3 [Lineus longissimus]|uniref:band 3 anion transport protein-like isoform X3 n=1 Tax=Lineus longissimus TaxID=88925 RepID=UPI00315DDC25
MDEQMKAQEDIIKAKELEEKRKMDREENFHDIFRPVGKFDVSYADWEPVPENRHNFSERDYSVHRKREFPHVHHPLKSLKKKKKRRDQRKRKKKKKHEVKFTPSLPGVEEDDEPDYSLDSDTSSSSLSGEDSDIPPVSSVPSIQVDPPKDGETKKRPTHIGFKPEVGESPTRHRPPGMDEATRVGLPSVDSPDGLLSPADGTRKKSTGSLPGSRRNSDSTKLPGTGTPRKSSIKNTDLRMAFLNRKLSETGLPSPMSTDSLRSTPEVAAEEFHVESTYVPEPSRMFASGSDPVVSICNQQELPEFSADPAAKVKFSLGDDDEEDHLRETEALMANYDAESPDIALSPALESDERTTSQPDAKPKKHKHHHHHHHHKRRHHYPQENYNLEDLLERRHAGSETSIHPSLKRVPTEPDEAALLHLAALDNMKSHRLEDARGIRRHKIRHSAMASIVSIGKAEDPRRPSHTPARMRQYDHSPHDVFVELDELFVGDQNELEWREKARWIKFEEDVEEDAEKWGKPHVASLSFHSLLDLRRCLEKCAILLDLEASDLTSIVSQTVDKLVIADQITDDDRPKVFRALLLKHKHVEAQRISRRRTMPAVHIEALSELGRRFSSFSPDRGRSASVANRDAIELEELVHMHDDKQTAANVVRNLSSASLTRVLGSSHSLKEKESKLPSKGDSTSTVEAISYTKVDDVHVDIDNNTVSAQDETVSLEVPKLKRPETAGGRQQHDIMKKIPKGSEAMTVLVGAVEFLDKPIMAFIRLAEGQYLANLTEVPLPVRFLFILLGPEHAGLDYHEMGRSVSTLMSNKMFHDTAYHADRRQDLLSAINTFLDDSIVLPPGEWDRDTLLPMKVNEVRQRRRKQEKKEREEKERKEPKDEVDSTSLLEAEKAAKMDMDPLLRTKRVFGGLVNDVKIRYPFYLSDIKDGLNSQCFAAFIFIYFACLAPAITFGGLLGEKTNGWMGVGEMFVGVCVCGLIFTVFSGQPLLILGHTGPLLVFEEAMYGFCSSNNLTYMPMRAWIGIWVMLITIVVVMLEGSVLVRYITSFTEEVFATLISLIFIYEVFRKLYVIFTQHPLLSVYPGPCLVPEASLNNTTDVLNASYLVMTTLMPSTVDYANLSLGNETIVKPAEPLNQPNTFLLCVILTFGTFIIANLLRRFRNSNLLGRTARRAIGDFGIPIAIIIMTLVDYFIADVYTQKLNVPPGIQPTSAERKSWFINPMDEIEIWQIFAAIIPAFLIFILFFMETSITGVIVNKKERRLKKGSGFHLDLFIIGILNGFCGVFGLPFMTAATVRSVTHVSALTVFSKTHAPGEKPKLLEVKEQRLTNFLVHVLIGISVLMSPVLKEIPIAVLFGVFLYMGVASMSGITLLDRCLLVLMPEKHHPEVDYVKKVRTRKMHLFTFLQVLWLVILWIVKSTAASLGFPFFLLMMIPFRLFLLKFMFEKKELAALDSEEVEVEEDDGNEADDEAGDDEPDFYQGSHLPSHPRLSMAHLYQHPSNASFTRTPSLVPS